MEVTIEDHTAYERSVLWKLHDAYFATRGAPAWTEREIPFFATSNYAFARQHARFLVEVVPELERAGALAPDGEVAILEVGCGLGDFAASFFQALERGCGDAGRALRRRVRYLLSDYSRRTVEDAVRRPELAPLAAEGALVPATLDVGRPDELRDLEGRGLARPLTAVIANYVCCVSRARLVRHGDEGWAEGLVRVTTEVPDILANVPLEPVRDALLSDPLRAGLLAKELRTHVRWEPVELASVAPDPLHAGTLRDLLESRASATLVYPQAFLDLIRALAKHLVPGGLALVSDFGSATRDVFDADDAAVPVYYGNTLNHGVAFAIFDAFAARAGFGLLRSRDPFASLLTAAFRAGGAPSPATRRAFRRAFVRTSEGQELTELRSAAAALAEAKDRRGAARLLARCLELDPDSAELHHRLGSLCLDAGWDRLALRYLRRGEKLDRARKLDFAFLIGRIHMRRGAPERARRAFRRAVKQEPSAVHWMSLGMAHEKLDQYREAYVAFRNSLDRDSESAMARKLMLRIIEQYLPKAWAASVAPEQPGTHQ